MLHYYFYSIYIQGIQTWPSLSTKELGGLDHVTFLNVHMLSHVIWEKIHQVGIYASLLSSFNDIMAAKWKNAGFQPEKTAQTVCFMDTYC